MSGTELKKKETEGQKGDEQLEKREYGENPA